MVIADHETSLILYITVCKQLFMIIIVQNYLSESKAYNPLIYLLFIKILINCKYFKKINK